MCSIITLFQKINFFINTPKAPTNLGVFLSSRVQALSLQKVNIMFLEDLSSIQSNF